MTDLAPHPVFAAKGGFGDLRLGRIKPTEPAKLALEPFVDEATFVAPPSADFYSAVPSWPMYGNDELGDCTCAAAGHMVQAWSAAAGHLKTMDDADVVKMYWETGSPPSDTGEPGGDTDTGRYETSVLGYWRRHGIAAGETWADRIVAYARVNVANLTKVKATCAMLGGVYIGIELPLTAQSQEIWDVVPDAGEQGQPGSWGGHAVPIVGYDDDYFYVVTWGAVLKMTMAFFQEYVDEAYAVISTDFVTDGKATGVNLDGIHAELAALTSGAENPEDNDAAGADLPADEQAPTGAPSSASQPASAAEDAPETPSGYAFHVSVEPDVVHSATDDPDNAKTIFLHTLANNRDLITVTALEGSG